MSNKLSRKTFLVYVNVAEGGSEYDWALTGIGTEELNVEFNLNRESVTDIYGVTRGSVTPGEKTITIDNNKYIADDKLFESLLKKVRNSDYNGMTSYDVLIVYGFMPSNEDGGYEAEIHKGCTVMLTSLGGSSDDLNAPYEIALSDDKVLGTVTTNDWRVAPTFTPSV